MCLCVVNIEVIVVVMFDYGFDVGCVEGLVIYLYLEVCLWCVDSLVVCVCLDYLLVWCCCFVVEYFVGVCWVLCELGLVICVFSERVLG